MGNVEKKNMNVHQKKRGHSADYSFTTLNVLMKSKLTGGEIPIHTLKLSHLAQIHISDNYVGKK